MGVKVRERPKGSGTWWLFIDHNGRRKARKVGTGPKAKATAEEVKAKLEAKIVLGDFDLDDRSETTPTFAEYAKTWEQTVLPATCKRSTVSDYRTMMEKHVIPVFGARPVDEITRKDVKTFLTGKTIDGYAVSTVTHLKSILGGVFALALDDRKITEHPAHRLGKKAIRSKSLKVEADPLSREELTLLLDTFREHYPRHYPLVLTLARTGMRRGEAIGLQWGDIDFHGHFITVRRNIARGKVETPKSGKARKVDMSDQLTEVLKGLLHHRKEETLRKGWGEVPDWVFVNEDGSMICGTSWKRRVFNPALAKAELRRVRIHDLRHTYATRLIQNGVSLAYIRDQLGHHSIKMTVDEYGHLVPGDNRGAVNALDDATIRNPAATGKDKGATQSA